MKINEEKLRIARVLSGYSLTDLAEVLGISKQSLSQYENGIEPRSDILLKILKELNCTMEFLEKPFQDDVIIKNKFFRATAAATANERKNQETKTTMVIRLYEFLQNFLDLPALDIPSNFTDDLSIEDKANLLREYWGLGDKPISNIINCLESKGIVVSSFNSSNDKVLSYKIDAYTQPFYSNGKTNFCVIVEDNKESWARKNFSLAHELGHIILHGNEDSYVDKSRTEQNEIESEANNFAAAFLLPAEPFKKDMIFVRKLDDFISLKAKWKVSIGAMLLRARQLEIISPEQYTKYIKYYSYRNYRKGEPLDDQIPIFKPTLFKRCLELLFENGYSIEQFQKDLSIRGLSLPLATIEDLLCLGKHFFDKYLPQAPITIKFPKTN